MTSARTTSARVAPWLCLVVLLSSACGGGDASGPDALPTGAPATATPSPTTASTVTEPTRPGSVLEHGEAATVGWQSAPDVTVVASLVVDRVVAAPRSDLRGWQLDTEARASAPHYVHVEATNLGDADIGGVALPLYAAADDGLVPASTFGAEFEPCPSGPLPSPLPAGDSATVCLVYLVPDGGRVERVEFRPTAGVDPISWAGRVRRGRR